MGRETAAFVVFESVRVGDGARWDWTHRRRRLGEARRSRWRPEGFYNAYIVLEDCQKAL